MQESHPKSNRRTERLVGCEPADVSPVPEHLHSVTPRLVVHDGAQAIEFYRDASAAEEIGKRFTDPNGAVIHAEIRSGDPVVMITDETGDGAPVQGPASLDGAVTAMMATYWADLYAVWERAVGAGAEVFYPLADQLYGKRGGRLRDPFGQQWMLSHRTENLTAQEMNLRTTKFLGSS